MTLEEIATKAADAVGATVYSDTRIFVKEAVKYAFDEMMREPLAIRPFLVSALVEMPGKIGHRARIVNAESYAAALGSSLALWQVDGWSVTSFDCSKCEAVIPKPSDPQKQANT